MNDTVTKILTLADEYRNAGPHPFNASKVARQALQDELVRLFTPLTPAQIHNADQHPHIMFDTQRIEFARAVEVLHGITGEKND